MSLKIRRIYYAVYAVQSAVHSIGTAEPQHRPCLKLILAEYLGIFLLR